MVKHVFAVLLSLVVVKSTFGSSIDQSATSIFNSGDSSRFQEVYMNALKQLKPSLSSKTSMGNSYSLFAIKRSSGWNFLILDSSSYYSFRQENGGKKDADGKAELLENSDSYTNMLCMAAQAKSLKLISKPKNVSGLTFTCYYKFRPQAKRMYRSFVKVQRKAKFVETNLGNGAAGKMKIFKSFMK